MLNFIKKKKLSYSYNKYHDLINIIKDDFINIIDIQKCIKKYIIIFQKFVVNFFYLSKIFFNI